MIKKIPIRRVSKRDYLVGHRPKSIILKSESSPKYSLLHSEFKAEKAGRSKFNELFDPDNNTWESIKMKSVKSSAAEDIASRTGTKRWGTLIKKNLTREGIFKKTISTSKDKPSFIKKWQKSLTSADVGAEATRVRTSLLFTGRKGLDPLKHQSTELQYIKSKRFKKAGMDPYGKAMMPGKDYSKLERGAYGQKKRMAEFASQATNLTKQGEVNWKKFWKTEGPRQAGYIKYRRRQLKDWRKPPKKK